MEDEPTMVEPDPDIPQTEDVYPQEAGLGGVTAEEGAPGDEGMHATPPEDDFGASTPEDLVSPPLETTDAGVLPHGDTAATVPDEATKIKDAIRVIVDGGNTSVTLMAEILSTDHYSNYAAAVADANGVFNILNLLTQGDSF